MFGSGYTDYYNEGTKIKYLLDVNLLKFVAEDVDYDFGLYNITFLAGETRATFNVTVIDDNIFEDNEKFILNIKPLSNIVTVGEPSRATVTIVDNDGKYFCLNKFPIASCL